jgi:hypothetical protein
MRSIFTSYLDPNVSRLFSLPLNPNSSSSYVFNNSLKASGKKVDEGRRWMRKGRGGCPGRPWAEG